ALRQQGVDIQKRASSAMLDMKVLEEAFGEVMGAIDDLSTYRQEALPRLDEQIDRLAALSKKGNASIERLREGSEAQPMDDHFDKPATDNRDPN
ncbi:MAG TPA: toxic anion resistance protein, partial [Halomonas sp.]|nr:toxic anion resistance protein [Halomonas sp.]